MNPVTEFFDTLRDSRAFWGVVGIAVVTAVLALWPSKKKRR
jgi:hypothetical protein